MKTDEEALKTIKFPVSLVYHPNAKRLLSFDSKIGKVYTLLPYGFPAASPAHFMISQTDWDNIPRGPYDPERGNRPQIMNHVGYVNDPILGVLVRIYLQPQRWNPNRDGADTWVRIVTVSIDRALSSLGVKP